MKYQLAELIDLETCKTILENFCEAVNIGSGVHCVAILNLLGRHKVGRPHHLPRHRHPVVATWQDVHAGQSEIKDLDRSVP